MIIKFLDTTGGKQFRRAFRRDLACLERAEIWRLISCMIFWPCRMIREAALDVNVPESMVTTLLNLKSV
jgi:hypothetical protein